MTSLVGASVWEQHFYDHLVSHIMSERDTLEAYAKLAEQTASPAFAFLARLILDDERRHHQLLSDLAETIRITATFADDTPPVPPLTPFGTDRALIAAETRRLLAVERADRRALRHLAADLRDFKDTTLWHLVVRLLLMDNAKHRDILTFIRNHAARSGP
jgi:rubrerythrin